MRLAKLFAFSLFLVPGLAAADNPPAAPSPYSTEPVMQPAQNTAVQRITPNEKRGQLSAFYLFMFTFFGALGSYVIGAVSTYVVVDESKVWLSILITAAIFLPTATYLMYRGIRPYREEVMRLEKLGM